MGGASGGLAAGTPVAKRRLQNVSTNVPNHQLKAGPVTTENATPVPGNPKATNQPVRATPMLERDCSTFPSGTKAHSGCNKCARPSATNARQRISPIIALVKQVNEKVGRHLSKHWRIKRTRRHRLRIQFIPRERVSRAMF